MAIMMHNVIEDKFFHNIPLALLFVWKYVFNKVFIYNYSCQKVTIFKIDILDIQCHQNR